MTEAINTNYNNLQNCNNEFYVKRFSVNNSTTPQIANSAQIQPQLQQDSVELTAQASKNKKNKKIRNVLVCAFAATAIIGTVFAGVKTGKFNGKEFSKYTSKLKGLSANGTTLKDDLWDRFADKLDEKGIHCVKKAGNSISNLYRKIVQKPLSPRYTNAVKAIQEAGGESLIKDGKITEDFSKLFKEMDSELGKIAKSDRVSKGLTKGSSQSKIKNLISNLTTPQCERNLGNLRSKYLIEVTDKIKENPQLEKSILNYNKLIQDEMIGKLRDINYGCAPTDIITQVLVPGAVFGGAMALTDTKEERKSTIINLGVPLFPSLLMPVLGLIFPILNGWKGMVFGLAVGQAVKLGIKGATGQLNKNKNKDGINQVA